MKKLLCFITALLLAVSLPIAVSADTEAKKVVDDANLLSDSEEKALTEKIDTLVAKYNCDIVAVTTADLKGKTVQAYADDYYDNNGYGVGNGDDGILFLYSKDGNQAAISTYGYGIKAFTDYGIDYIFDEVTPAIKSKDFNKTFNTYVTLCDKFLKQAKAGKPYSKNNKVKTTKDYLIYEAAVLGVSLVLALVIVLVMKSRMNTALKKTTAGDYVRDGSFNLTEKRDVYMYSHVTKVKIESSSSSGGGSSTHSSSSGRSHGGGSRSF